MTVGCRVRKSRHLCIDGMGAVWCEVTITEVADIVSLSTAGESII